MELDDDFDVKKITLLYGVVFIIGFVLLLLICKIMAKNRYKRDLTKAVDKYVTEYNKL